MDINGLINLPSTFDLDSTLLNLTPTRIQEDSIFTPERLIQLKNLTKTTLVLSKNHGWDSLTNEKKNGIIELLWLYDYCIGLPLEISLKGAPVHADDILDIMINAKYHLPLEIRYCAAAIKIELEAHNWGAAQPPPLDLAINNNLNIEDQKTISNTLKQKRKPYKKRNANASNQMNTKNNSSSVYKFNRPYQTTWDTRYLKGVTKYKQTELRNRNNKTKIKRPPPTYHPAPSTHPIYGVDGIMHHIQVCGPPRRRSYRLDPAYAKRDGKVFGNNGLKVGDCWANRMAALRDGAHGRTEAGLSGCPDGIYSLVISRKYTSLGRQYDTGTSFTCIITPAQMSASTTDYLRQSASNKKPIRVLRTSGAAWEFAPRAGIRYDGLYVVEGYEEGVNPGDARKFLTFYLKRMDGQAEIEKWAPSERLSKTFEAVTEGY